jgi:putative transposase
MMALAEDKSSEPEVPRAQRRPQAQPLSHFVNAYADPKEGMIQAYRSGDYTLAQVAQAFDVHYSTVSRAISESRRG